MAAGGVTEELWMVALIFNKLTGRAELTIFDFNKLTGFDFLMVVRLLKNRKYQDERLWQLIRAGAWPLPMCVALEFGVSRCNNGVPGS
jgi:hypothetical protein